MGITIAVMTTYISADSAADCADCDGCSVEAGVLSLDTGSSVLVVSVFVLQSEFQLTLIAVVRCDIIGDILRECNTYSTFADALTFVELASSVLTVDAVDEVVVDATSSSSFVSFFAHLFTITTINFFSSKLYEEIVFSSANIIPETANQQRH